jgi:hypothetical protein
MSITDLITLLSSLVQNSEGGANDDDSCAGLFQEFKKGFLGVTSGVFPCLIILLDKFKYIRV